MKPRCEDPKCPRYGQELDKNCICSPKLIGRWVAKNLVEEFHLCDVDYFEEYHETDQNGNKLKAVLNEERQGSNPKYGFGWVLLGKDNPLRAKIIRQVRKRGKIVTKGSNPGTPVARTWNVRQLKASKVVL